ncbi:YdcF family protein [Derxia lacustris]|uniref:YdcF family protein n=1 Tax=Derxia lacustris TaxID=764842 RepID=UPI000A178666|nr:YdcF family protein [Derxia lacustris]
MFDWLLSGWFWSSLVSTLLLPPASPLLLIAASIGLMPRRPNLGWLLLILAFTFLWLASTNYVALSAQRIYLNGVRPFDPATLPHFKPEFRPTAIVVLGGGRVLRAAGERGQTEDLGDASIARLRQAVHVARATRLPITVSGGRPEGGDWSEAAIMARVLSDDFALPARYVEEDSTSTTGNASRVARMLIPAGMSNIILVTDAVHMPRARAAFAEAGFTVYAAPVPPRLPNPINPREWLPTADALGTSRALLRELAALAWFHISATYRHAPR